MVSHNGQSHRSVSLVSLSGQSQWSVSVVSLTGQSYWSVSIVSLSGQLVCVFTQQIRLFERTMYMKCVSASTGIDLSGVCLCLCVSVCVSVCVCTHRKKTGKSTDQKSVY